MAKAVELVVRSRIKEAVKDLNIASDVSEKLNERLTQMLREGQERAKANGRRTLQARDL